MNRFQLAKLIDWAETLESRKRMQKVVFMMQAAGCPLQVDFYLHRYGPYASEVASLTDQLVRDGILDETETTNTYGNSQYKYQLSPLGQTAIEKAVSGASGTDAILDYESLAKSLLNESLRNIEVASTIVFYRMASMDWETAKQKAFQFKGVLPSSTEATHAEALARKVFP